MSDRAKITIELDNKLINNGKVIPLLLDQVLGNEGTILLAHLGSTKMNERQQKIVDTEYLQKKEFSACMMIPKIEN